VSTALRVVEQPEDSWGAPPGDMWPCPHAEGSHRVEGRSACWVVRLPGKAWVWHTNETAGGSGAYWIVTGEPPAISVQPSINAGDDVWHGWITNGEMTP
jgi:hypothetical protein